MITLCIYFKINHQSTINYGWVNNWNGRPKQNERFIELIWICWRNKRLRGKFVIYLASVGLYVTSYLSAFSWEVAHDTLTDVGFKNVTVMFSGTPGPPGIEPATRKNTVRKQKREKKMMCRYLNYTQIDRLWKWWERVNKFVVLNGHVSYSARLNCRGERQWKESAGERIINRCVCVCVCGCKYSIVGCPRH